MAAALGALGDDDVGAGVGRAPGLVNGRDHVHHAGTRRVGPGEERGQVELGPWPGCREYGRSGGEHRVDGRGVGLEQQQVESERTIGGGADGAGQLRDLVRRATGAALDAQAAAVANRDDQLGAGATAHPAEHNRVLDAEKLAGSGSHQHLG